MKTQKKLVEEQLKKYGKVSRNWALKRYISRLGAIICSLNKEGYKLMGQYQKEGNGQNYYYYDLNFSRKMAKRLSK